MKKQSIQTIAKRFFFGNLLAAALFLSASANTQTAHIKAVANTATASDKAEVKFTGIDLNNQLSFNVKYQNPLGGTFTMVILDEEGETLFKGFFADKNFDKTFKLPKSEMSKLTFVIQDSRNSVKEIFNVNVKTSVKEEVIVSKG